MANKAVVFTGSEYISIAADSSQITRNGWIEAVIYANNTGTDNYMGQLAAGNQNDWTLATSSTKLNVRIDIPIGAFSIDSDNAVITGTFFHWAFQWGDDGVKQYVNSVVQAETNAYTGSVGRAVAINLGGLGGAGSFHGKIAMYRQYNRLPGATEIADNYNSGNFRFWPSRHDGIVIWLPMNEGAGTSVFDRSSYGQTGTFIGGPTWADGFDFLNMTHVPRRR